MFCFRFTTPHHREGFELFLDTITELEDVWLVTSWQAIQWMRWVERKIFDRTVIERIFKHLTFAGTQLL